MFGKELAYHRPQNDFSGCKREESPVISTLAIDYYNSLYIRARREIAPLLRPVLINARSFS